MGLGPTPRKGEVTTSRYLPLGSSPTQQVEKRKRELLEGDDGIGHAGRSVTHWLLPAAREKGTAACPAGDYR